MYDRASNKLAVPLLVNNITMATRLAYTFVACGNTTSDQVPNKTDIASKIQVATDPRWQVEIGWEEGWWGEVRRR